MYHPIKNKAYILVVLIVSLLSGCNMGPKTTEPFAVKQIPQKGHFGSDVDLEMHEVVAKEILPAGKYIYIKVEEGGREFWISARKQPIEEGTAYLYNEALMKTAFESKEHQRVFDTIYLVTTLIPKKHGGESLMNNKMDDISKKAETIKNSVVSTEERDRLYHGTVKVSDLVENPEKYAGKVVELSGECAKVNNGIMGKNWIHLKDGSQDDFDLVITSATEIEKGDKITMRGIVRLNRDFGSGYSYDILVEEGELIQ
ncbi:hypothetical protein [Flagellimonas meishanensis]|uniref:hypothetical protein n=1 Tax=Flagellimonas meishanensis TaxID=2873264 RepID=UPI001CA69A14|nr:hypothetical protein [[Muricauda] meishanensis]